MLRPELRTFLEEEQLSLINAMETADQDSKEYEMATKRIGDIQRILDADDKALNDAKIAEAKLDAEKSKANIEAEKSKAKEEEPKWFGILTRIVIPVLGILVPAGISIAKIDLRKTETAVATCLERDGTIASKIANRILINERTKID